MIRQQITSPEPLTWCIFRERVCEVCEEHCEKCGVGECLRCQDGFWLQDGRCLSQCLPGHYQGPRNTCLSKERRLLAIGSEIKLDKLN